ncbi:S8 family serine peptidase [Flammeovirga sp. EKP202]|uniref:S8 family serine peptidase n=1 Tax=Flammeovirga sp. EKP202 TaxID=2770592 RepID=UPI00165FF729|nr:S8 family serine peptidase [Flammeovirga sp. EKP202]MBD0401904.1 S8 family serine peptidase [Flammeovirga sp. EKP202]
MTIRLDIYSVFFSGEKRLRRLFLSYFFILFTVFPVFADENQRFWVVFVDKCNNEDLEIFNQSICQEYIEALHEQDFFAQTKSNWLNAVTVEITSKKELDQLKSLSFIKEVKPVNRGWKLASIHQESDFKQSSYTVKQIQPKSIYDLKLDGSGVTVGVIDAGYYNATKNTYLKHIFKDERVLGFKDYLSGPSTTSQTFFGTKRTSSDSHGTTVLRMIAGQEGNMRYGLADKSNFYLARTDHGDKESRSEEENWIMALEWMVDSLGIKLINSSLGYTNGFDLKDENYLPSQMDGETSMVTKAAEVATQEKDVLLVVSAGNEGDSNWKIISAPADAKGVLSVGATTKSGVKASYSSLGPTFLEYIKPEVSCYSLFGTSFSAPVITGLAACLWQMKPEATAKEIRGAIIQSSWFYPYGNNYVGYGVPNAGKAINILKGIPLENQTEIIHAQNEKNIEIIPQEGEGTLLIAYHKVSETVVIKQEFIYLNNDAWKVKKTKKSISTTLWTGDRHIEIFWK